MSKEVTKLLDLEDLSLFCFFKYLSFRQRITLFVDLPHCRIQPLLQSFISFVDITNEDNKWIEEYLPKILIQRKIHGLRLKEEQIHLISKYFALGSIQTIELTSTCLNDEVPINDCISLSQSLNKLILLYDNDARYKQIRAIKNQTQENIYSRYIYPIIGQNCTFHNLTDLSINLLKIHHIFDILPHSPNLQTLKMHLEDLYDWDKSDIDIINPCRVLRNVKITGVIENNDGLNKFFTFFGSTIQFLTLNVRITTDDHSIQFNYDIFDKMPLLFSFNFIIERILCSREQHVINLVDDEIFKTDRWQQFGPIIRWKRYKDQCYYSYIICNLPYKFDCFCIPKKNFNLYYIGNKQNPPIFEHVRTILLRHMYPSWSTKVFNFIRNSFPNIRTLYFHSILSERERDYVHSFLESYPDIFDDELRNNTEIQLPTVTTICLSIEIEQYTNATLKYLFNLLPNLKVIKTDDLKYAQEKKEFYGLYYDEIVENKLNSLTIKPYTLPNNFPYI